MKVLVTGGLGYIGSHTAAALLAAGHEAVLLDDLSNSKMSVLARLETIAGQPVPFERCDLLDAAATDAVFAKYRFDAVIHFAAFKAVGESQTKPVRYYRNNLGSLLNVLDAMKAHGVRRLVFSSSACVYGVPDENPIPETAPLCPENVYGRTKQSCEQILRDFAAAQPEFAFAILRYFNPIGAHESGLIGEDPAGIPNNLMPYITQVAAGKRPQLTVYGGDYETPDGTGVRDYIHVCDLAEGHIAALAKLAQGAGVLTYNLGCGRGFSVLEIVAAFERANGVAVPYRIGARRPGDIACYYSDPSLAERELGWHARRSLDDMCRDSWRWQRYAAEHAL